MEELDQEAQQQTQQSINSKQHQHQQQQQQQQQTIERSSEESTTETQSPALLSPFNFIHCHKCRRDFKSEGPKFYLTSCSHSICFQCFNPAPFSNNDRDSLLSDSQVLICPVCNHRGKTVWLETSLQAVGMEGLRHCFTPLPDLMDDVRQSLEFQFGNIVDQMTFFKNKVIQQQQVLSKLSTEFKGMKELRNRNTRLEIENTNLRGELSNALELLDSNLANSGPNLLQPQTYQKRQYLSPHSQQSNRPSPIPRPAPQNSILPPGARSIPNNLPLQPNRLSLEPTSSARTLLLSSRQRNRPSTSGGEENSNYGRGSGVISRGDSGNYSVGADTGGRDGGISDYAKERIGSFAYITPQNRDQIPPRSHSSNLNSSRRETFTPLPQQSRPSTSTANQHHPYQQQYQNGQQRQSIESFPESKQFQYSVEYEEERSHPPKRSRLNYPSPASISNSPFNVPASTISRGVTPMPFPTRGSSSMGFSSLHQPTNQHQQQQPNYLYNNSMPQPSIPTPTSNLRNNAIVQRRPFQSQNQQVKEVEPNRRGTPRPRSGMGSGFRYVESTGFAG